MANDHPSPPLAPGLDEFALASIACGIAGIVLAILLGIVGVVIGVVALVLARIGRAKAARRRVSPRPAITGMVTGWFAIVVGVANILLAVAQWE